jgi:hypothetical protein
MTTKKGMLASIVVGAAFLAPTIPVEAQWVQNPIGIPIAPGCPAGESWTKNGDRFVCETPAPSCANGFASAPVWTGTAWSFACNAPLPPPGGQGSNPTPTIADVCAQRAAQQGITAMGPVTIGTRGDDGRPLTELDYQQAVGPTFTNFDGTMGNSWQVVCIFDTATGNWAPANTNPFSVTQNNDNGFGQGGGS